MDVLALFRSTARQVPAYASFLHDRDIDPAAVSDVAQIPLLTKDEYHQRYPLPERCRDGRLVAAGMVAVSSGSSGRPTVWPRSIADERAVTDRFEQVFRDGFRAAERSTLAVVCFALGNWVGGMYTVASLRRLAEDGYPVTVAAPGNNVDEILRVIEELGGFYDQTVLLGYPPFVKNVVDAGLTRGVGWPAYRRFLADRPAVSSSLFGDARLPTLVQYDPSSRFFETTPEGTLLFSADGVQPLVRYHIADEGGLHTRDELVALCREHGFDPGDGPDLPFVHLFGRSLFTVSFFGANVYPENVTVGLERPGISSWTTGRFVLRSVEDDDRDRRLVIVVELAPGAAATAGRAAAAAESIRTELLRLNSEFAHYVPLSSQTPEVELRPADDPSWFPAGVKHRYTRP